MVCPICFAEEDVIVMESWAGAFHSACVHGACAPCLATWVDALVPSCRKNMMLRVPCFDPSCKKFMPNSVACHVSALARGLARQVDQDPLLDNEHMQECPICCSYIGPLLVHKGDAACEDCWEKFVDHQLPRCRAARALECQTFTHQPMAAAIACRTSSAARHFKKQLQRREKLQDNILFPKALQVDCPQPGCVGLGYLGVETIMCFICEHQWASPTLEEAASTGELPSEVKKCPSCSWPIEKNGGCDHMTCRCGHEFFWTTLLPYRR